MKSRKSLLINLTPSCVYRFVHGGEIPLSGKSGFVNFEEASFIEIRSFGDYTKPFSKREECEISDISREWISDFLLREDLGEVKVIVSSDFTEIVGSENLINSLLSYSRCKVERFSLKEETRQCLLGLRNYSGTLSELGQKMAFLSFKKSKSCLVIADEHLILDSEQMNFGIQDEAEVIASLFPLDASERQVLEAADVIKGKLPEFLKYKFSSGSVPLLCLDENLSRLLIKVLRRNIVTQKLPIALLSEFVGQLFRSGMRYLSEFESVSSSNAAYVASIFISLHEICKEFGVENLLLSPDTRAKGFVLNEFIEKGELRNEFPGHLNDWKRSAREVLLRWDPANLVPAMQTAELSSKLISATEELLPMFSANDIKLLWLCSFLYSSLHKVNSSLAIDLVSEIYGLNFEEVRFIVFTIFCAATENISERSQHLDALSPAMRVVNRKLFPLIQMANSLNISGNSPIQDVKFSGKPNSNDLLMRIAPRFGKSLNLELAQLNRVKRNLESSFQQKLDIEVSKI